MNEPSLNPDIALDILQYRWATPGMTEPRIIGNRRVSRRALQVFYHVYSQTGWESLPLDQEAQQLCETALLLSNQRPGTVQKGYESNDRRVKLDLHHDVACQVHQSWYVRNDVGEWLSVKQEDIPLEIRCDLLAAYCPTVSRLDLTRHR